MNKRQHDTRVALRRAVRVYGPDSSETQEAAILFCYAHNIDPHFRHALYPKIKPPTMNLDELIDMKLYSITQWQQIVQRFVKDQTE